MSKQIYGASPSTSQTSKTDPKNEPLEATFVPHAGAKTDLKSNKNQSKIDIDIELRFRLDVGTVLVSKMEAPNPKIVKNPLGFIMFS